MWGVGGSRAASVAEGARAVLHLHRNPRCHFGLRGGAYGFSQRQLHRAQAQSCRDRQPSPSYTWFIITSLLHVYVSWWAVYFQYGVQHGYLLHFPFRPQNQFGGVPCSGLWSPCCREPAGIWQGNLTPNQSSFQFYMLCKSNLLTFFLTERSSSNFN